MALLGRAHVPEYEQAVALCQEVCAQVGAESAELGVTHLRHAM